MVLMSSSIRQASSPILVIGAAHAGKSAFAIQTLNPEVETCVIGTAYTKEPAFQERIRELKAMRPKNWHHLEPEENVLSHIANAMSSFPQVLVDSLNQWMANSIIALLSSYSADQIDAIINANINELVETISKGQARVCLVTSEVGAGTTPPKEVERLFRQKMGSMNMKLAQACPSVFLVSAGLWLSLKEAA